MKSNISTTKIDILNRTPFVDQLFDIVEKLSEKQKSCTFAVNGKWGCGKSFVMDMFEEKIKTQQNEETANDKYLLFHYDCWEYDYYEEPLFAIVSAILDKIKSEAKNPIFEKAKIDFSIAIRALDKLSGFGLVENIRKAEKEYEEDHNPTDFDAYFGFKDTLKEVQTAFQKLAEDKTLVVVVDELDRCLPTYTVKVLERLHHIFGEIKNCIVILAVDKEQLEHTVQSIYGTDCNTDAYLRKFIDFEIDLNNGISSAKYTEKYKEYISYFSPSPFYQFDNIEELFSSAFFGLNPRIADKIIRKATLIHELTFSDLATSDYALMLAELLYLILQTNNQRELSIRSVKFPPHNPFENYKTNEKIHGLFLQNAHQLHLGESDDPETIKAYYVLNEQTLNIYTHTLFYLSNMFRDKCSQKYSIGFTLKEKELTMYEKNKRIAIKFAKIADTIL